MNTLMSFLNMHLITLSTLCEFFLLYWTLVSLFVPGSGKKHLLLTCSFGILSLLVYQALDYFLAIRFPNYLLFYLLFGVIFILIFIHKKRANAVLTLVFFVFGSAFLRFTVDSFLRAVLPEHFLFSIYFNLVSNGLVLLCVILYTRALIRFFIPSDLNLPWYYQLPLIFLFVTFFIFLKLAGYFSENTMVFTAYFFLMIVMVCVIYFLFFHIARDNEERMRNHLLIQEIELKEAHIHETQELYQKLRVLRHELKNHMFYLKTLADQKEYDKLTDYIGDFTKNYQKASEFIETGNVTVNAILQSYCSLALEQNIPFTVTAALPDRLAISDGPLFSLLSNLLDNALEGVNPDDPAVFVELKIVKAYLSITVKNTVRTNVLLENPSLKTTKPEAERHGIGTQVIEHITEEYNGILERFCENGIFTVSILLTNDTNQNVHPPC